MYFIHSQRTWKVLKDWSIIIDILHSNDHFDSAVVTLICHSHENPQCLRKESLQAWKEQGSRITSECQAIPT